MEKKRRLRKMKDVWKIKVTRVYELELTDSQDLTEQEAKAIFREEEPNNVDLLVSEKIQLINNIPPMDTISNGEIWQFIQENKGKTKELVGAWLISQHVNPTNKLFKAICAWNERDPK